MKQPTALEIFEAIGLLADHVEEIRTDMTGMKSDMTGMKSDIASMKSDMTGMKSDMTGMKSDIASMKSSMVTKDYLDDKLADHGSRYGMLIRQTNKKIGMLADALVSEKSLSSSAAKRITSAEPFGSKG